MPSSPVINIPSIDGAAIRRRLDRAYRAPSHKYGKEPPDPDVGLMTIEVRFFPHHSCAVMKVLLTIPERITVGELKQQVLEQAAIEPEIRQKMNNQNAHLRLFLDDGKEEELVPSSSLLIEDHGFRTASHLMGRRKDRAYLLLIAEYILDIHVTRYPEASRQHLATNNLSQEDEVCSSGGEFGLGCVVRVPITGVYGLNRLHHIKEMISLETNMPTSRLRIYRKGQENADTVTMYVPLNANREQWYTMWVNDWEISVRTLQGTVFLLGVDSDQTVEDLQKQIAKKASIQEQDHVLILSDGKMLGNEQLSWALERCGVTNHSTVYVVLKQYIPLSSEVVDGKQTGCTIPRQNTVESPWDSCERSQP
ncbi:unknown protein [Seminavis robusta]|uniref:Ubiquitin-like domain-containing protein n=1 Tax=Seminavis robusta TaxID=568900 RepID=A0A9N8ES63_9STRA|nr:unknown protein [Seminavis robusta]|eukprot:Sro1628_g286990.1 n/a (365) ;mRNA; r:12063-13157